MKYHRKTLELLKFDEPSLSIPEKLNAFEVSNEIVIPASFREWASYDTDGLLEKYSNCDSFFFTEPEIKEIKGLGKGLCFCRENQGNFDLVVLLDGSSDPPVYFGWCGDAPWVKYTESFSDAVFVQIFDWQYMLEFSEEGYADITDYRSKSIRGLKYLDAIDKYFNRSVSSRFVIDDVTSTIYRFYKNIDQRVSVAIQDNDDLLEITITSPENELDQIESEVGEVIKSKLWRNYDKKS